MGRIKKNRVVVAIKLDTELKNLLDARKVEKSSFINEILWKHFALERNIPQSQNPYLSSPESLTNVFI